MDFSERLKSFMGHILIPLFQERFFSVSKIYILIYQESADIIIKLAEMVSVMGRKRNQESYDLQRPKYSMQY